MARKSKNALISSVSDKSKVISWYPGSFVERVGDTQYTICDSDGNDLLSEYFLPFGNTPEEAWSYAGLTIKVTNNFNRTHPERLSLEIDEDKLSRIAKRKSKF